MLLAYTTYIWSLTSFDNSISSTGACFVPMVPALIKNLNSFSFLLNISLTLPNPSIVVFKIIVMHSVECKKIIVFVTGIKRKPDSSWTIKPFKTKIKCYTFLYHFRPTNFILNTHIHVLALTEYAERNKLKEYKL